MLTARSVSIWRRVHTWTSLIATAFLLLLCLTGLPLIYKDEIGVWSGAVVLPPVMPDDVPQLDLDELLRRALVLRPGLVPRFVSQDDDAPAWFFVLAPDVLAHEANVVLKLDARNGALLQQVPLQQGVMHVIRKLHIDLLSGFSGSLVLGVMALVFLIALISGAVLYAPFMRRLSFGTLRRRHAWLDFHNLLGIATMAWASVICITGAVNTLAGPLTQHWQNTELAALLVPWRNQAGPVAVGSLQAAADVSLQAHPGMAVRFIAFPGTPFAGRHHYMVALRGETPMTAKLVQPVLVEAESLHLSGMPVMPWYMTALLLAQPLHFGDYAGWPLKLLWTVFDLVMIAVLGSGLWLWLVRVGRRS